MISLLQLKYFLALANSGNLNQTASELFISPSTLSIMINRLEEELDVKLFDRSHKSMALNENGLLFYQYVSAASQSLNEGISKLNAVSSHNRPINVIIAHAREWYDIIRDFSKQNTDVSLKLFNDNILTAGKLLLNGTVDFVICGKEDLGIDNTEQIDLFTTGICVCTSPQNPLAQKDVLTVKELEGLPYIDLSPELPFRRYCDGLFRSAGITVNRLIECDYENRPGLVREGLGIALTTNQESTRRLYSGCSFIPLPDDISRTLSLFWLKGRLLSPAMHRFVDYFSQSAAYYL